MLLKGIRAVRRIRRWRHRAASQVRDSGQIATAAESGKHGSDGFRPDVGHRWRDTRDELRPSLFDSFVVLSPVALNHPGGFLALTILLLLGDLEVKLRREDASDVTAAKSLDLGGGGISELDLSRVVDLTGNKLLSLLTPALASEEAAHHVLDFRGGFFLSSFERHGFLICEIMAVADDGDGLGALFVLQASATAAHDVPTSDGLDLDCGLVSLKQSALSLEADALVRESFLDPEELLHEAARIGALFVVQARGELLAALFVEQTLKLPAGHVRACGALDSPSGDELLQREVLLDLLFDGALTAKAADVDALVSSAIHRLNFSCRCLAVEVRRHRLALELLRECSLAVGETLPAVVPGSEKRSDESGGILERFLALQAHGLELPAGFAFSLCDAHRSDFSPEALKDDGGDGLVVLALADDGHVLFGEDPPPEGLQFDCGVGPDDSNGAATSKFLVDRAAEPATAEPALNRDGVDGALHNTLLFSSGEFARRVPAPERGDLGRGFVPAQLNQLVSTDHQVVLFEFEKVLALNPQTNGLLDLARGCVALREAVDAESQENVLEAAEAAAEGLDRARRSCLSLERFQLGLGKVQADVALDALGGESVFREALFLLVDEPRDFLGGGHIFSREMAAPDTLDRLGVRLAEEEPVESFREGKARQRVPSARLNAHGITGSREQALFVGAALGRPARLANLPSTEAHVAIPLLDDASCATTRFFVPKDRVLRARGKASPRALHLGRCAVAAVGLVLESGEASASDDAAPQALDPARRHEAIGFAVVDSLLRCEAAIQATGETSAPDTLDLDDLAQARGGREHLLAAVHNEVAVPDARERAAHQGLDLGRRRVPALLLGTDHSHQLLLLPRLEEVLDLLGGGVLAADFFLVHLLLGRDSVQEFLLAANTVAAPASLNLSRGVEPLEAQRVESPPRVADSEEPTHGPHDQVARLNLLDVNFFLLLRFLLRDLGAGQVKAAPVRAVHGLDAQSSLRHRGDHVPCVVPSPKALDLDRARMKFADSLVSQRRLGFAVESLCFLFTLLDGGFLFFALSLRALFRVGRFCLLNGGLQSRIVFFFSVPSVSPRASPGDTPTSRSGRARARCAASSSRASVHHSSSASSRRS